MKKTDLHELIRYITKNVIKEYSVLSTSSNTSSTGDTDPNAPPTDAMTSYEKLKAEREKEKQHRQDVRTGEMKLKGVKKQSDYFNQQIKMNKLGITAQEKELQNLKAGKAISTGGAGSISP